MAHTVYVQLRVYPSLSVCKSLSLSVAVWGAEAAAPVLIRDRGATEPAIQPAESEVIYK